MRFLILSFIVLSYQPSWSKAFIKDYAIKPQKQYEIQSKIKNEKAILNLKVEITLSNKKDIKKINNKIKDLKLNGEFYPDYFNPLIFQAQVVGEKKSFDDFISYLKSQKIKAKIK